MTQKILKEMINYDPEVGIFKWIINNRRAGNLHIFGYRRIGISGKLYYEHRLAWLYMIGEFPENEIDHINGIRDDNRFSNLREATSSQNKINTTRNWLVGARRNSYPGCSSWYSVIRIDGKETYLGSFPTKEEAHLAFCNAAKRYHGEYRRA